jgi:transposase
LEELNARIAELVTDLNLRTMRKLGTTRRALFDAVERAALRPLPTEPFEVATWKRAKVHLDYHIELDRHYYSVPFRLVGEEVEVRATASTLEVFRREERVAAHPRSHLVGRHTTDAAHMPKSHQAHSQWSPERLIAWGRTIGPETGRLVEAILADRPHPEQGYRSCLGLLRLGKRYTPVRLERACTRALLAGARSYKHVDAILVRGLDQLPLAPAPPVGVAPTVHENIRGPANYD